jgi:hypothetical protein
MALAFSDLDNARENAALSSFYDGLGAIRNPEKFREDNLNREAFNNMVTLGTATFGAPLAAHGLEGLKSEIGVRFKARRAGSARRAAGRTLSEIVEDGRARAGAPDVPPADAPAPAAADAAADAAAGVEAALGDGAAAAAAAADGAGEVAAAGAGALAGLQGQLERRALIRSRAPSAGMRWASRVIARDRADEIVRGFYNNAGADPDNPIFAAHNPEGRILALDDEEPFLGEVGGGEDAAAARPTVAEGLATFARVRGRYLARAAAREPAAGDGEAPAAAAATPEETASQIEGMAQGLNAQAAASVTENSPRGAQMMADRAALRAERISRTVRGLSTDDLPANENWVPDGGLPTDLDYSERAEEFGQGVQDAQNGEYNDPGAAYDDADFGAEYREGHAAQTRINQLDDLQKVADHGLDDGSMTQPAEAAGPAPPGAVAPDVVDADPEAVAGAGARAGAGAAATEGEDVGSAVGRGFAAAGETIAEGGGPEDFLGDLAAIGIGLGTVFAGLGAQKRPEKPVEIPSIVPASAKGVI